MRAKEGCCLIRTDMFQCRAPGHVGRLTPDGAPRDMWGAWHRTCPSYPGVVEVSPERAFLVELENRLAAGEPVAIEVSLALLAGQDVELDPDELRGARRRAVQLLATGGDPHRDPEPDGRAVTALAADLDAPEHRAALADGLSSLNATVAGLPEVSARLERLSADQELAWRWFACTVLAEELVED